jgi:hypothetical protein
LGFGTGLLCLALVLAAQGCAAGGSNPFDRSTNSEVLILRAENQNLYDAVVYVRPGGRRQELGRVAARNVQFFEFDWPVGMPLDLEIELTGGERHRLLPQPLRGGVRLELIIAAELRRSVIRQ